MLYFKKNVDNLACFNNVGVHYHIYSFNSFFPFQATRSLCVSVEVSASQGKAPAIAVSRPAVLGQSEWPPRH